MTTTIRLHSMFVLNLIINGLPSKLRDLIAKKHAKGSFKPYYKWITF